MGQYMASESQLGPHQRCRMPTRQSMVKVSVVMKQIASALQLAGTF